MKDLWNIIDEFQFINGPYLTPFDSTVYLLSSRNPFKAISGTLNMKHLDQDLDRPSSRIRELLEIFFLKEINELFSCLSLVGQLFKNLQLTIFPITGELVYENCGKRA